MLASGVYEYVVRGKTICANQLPSAIALQAGLKTAAAYLAVDKSRPPAQGRVEQAEIHTCPGRGPRHRSRTKKVKDLPQAVAASVRRQKGVEPRG